MRQLKFFKQKALFFAFKIIQVKKWGKNFYSIYNRIIALGWRAASRYTV